MGELRRSKLYQRYFRRHVDPFQAKASTNVKFNAQFKEIANQKVPSYATRGNNIAPNGGVREMQPQFSFPFTSLSSSEVRRRAETRPQLEAVKWFLGSETFSSRQSPKSAEFSTAQRFSSQNRLNKCLSTCTYKTSSQKVPSCIVQQPVLSDDRSTVRSLGRSGSVRSTDKLGSKPVKIQRCSYNRIPGRFFTRKSGPEHPTKSDKINHKYLDRIRMDHKLGEINLGSNAQIRIPRDYMGHQKEYKIYQFKEVTKDKKSSTSDKRSSGLDLEKSEVIAGSASVRRFCGPFGPFELSIATKSCEQARRMSAGSNTRYTRSSCSRRELVVGKCAKKLPNLPEESNCFCVNRCVRLGLGFGTQWQNDVGPLEGYTKTMAYKRQGALCSSRDRKKTHRKFEGSGHSDTVRQPNCNFPHKEASRYKISAATRTVKTPPGDVSPSTHSNSPTIHSGTLQSDGRQSIPQEANRRMESVPICYPEDLRAMGYSRDRFVRDRIISSGTSICKPRSERQESGLHKRVQSEMDFQSGVGISSACINATSVAASEHCDRVVHNHSSEVGKIFLESRSSAESHCTSFPNSKSTTPSNRSDDRSSPVRSKQITIGGLENSGWSNLVKDWASENVALLESSWRKSTLHSYKAAWNRWLQWCNSNSVCHINPSATQLALFLCYLHTELNLAPRTIKVHKSVVCTFSNPSNVYSLGSQPIVARILKGIELSKPPIVKKNIWDVSEMIKWISDNPPQENSLFQLSRHVALLLLLSSGRRIHDLTLLHIGSDDMITTKDSLIFWPKFGSKTDSARFRQSGWELKSGQIKNLDIPFWSNKLISESESRRNARENLTNLFITTRGVVKAASRSVIAGWIRTAFECVGIKASPGSVRSAVASKNISSLPLDEVLSIGNWRSETTFFKHYFKEVNRVDFNSNQEPNSLNDSFKALL